MPATAASRGRRRNWRAIAAAEVLRGVRGAPAADLDALADVIRRVGDLVADFPEPAEVDLDPAPARPDGATAVDVRVLVDRNAAREPVRFSREEILTAMNRIVKPAAVAVIGASNEPGEIGNSVMRDLVDGGYRGDVYPIDPQGRRGAGPQGVPEHRRRPATWTSRCSPSPPGSCSPRWRRPAPRAWRARS